MFYMFLFWKEKYNQWDVESRKNVMIENKKKNLTKYICML